MTDEERLAEINAAGRARHDAGPGTNSPYVGKKKPTEDEGMGIAVANAVKSGAEATAAAQSEEQVPDRK